jgi:hypothetical protein
LHQLLAALGDRGGCNRVLIATASPRWRGDAAIAAFHSELAYRYPLRRRRDGARPLFEFSKLHSLQTKKPPHL